MFRIWYMYSKYCHILLVSICMYTFNSCISDNVSLLRRV